MSVDFNLTNFDHQKLKLTNTVNQYLGERKKY